MRPDAAVAAIVHHFDAEVVDVRCRSGVGGVRKPDQDDDGR
jgi:hypothetical protein